MDGSNARCDVSAAGLQFIAKFEGFVDHVYNDAIGIATVGYGHVVRKGETFPAKMSQSDGLALLHKDAAIAVAAVRRVANPLSQAQFDALVSFAFNLGGGVLSSSPSLSAALADRSFVHVPQTLLLFDHAGGKQLAGLTRRRQAEAKLFAHGVY